MSVETDPIPPVPTHTDFLNKEGPVREKVAVTYSNWFNLLRTKVNVISASLVSLGTTGILNAIYGGTGFNSYTVGDTLYADTTTTLAKLGIGTNGQVLAVVTGVPAWLTMQAAIQFKDEGTNVGSSGAITSLDVVGTGGTLTIIGTNATLTLSGGGGGLSIGLAQQLPNLPIFL